MPSHRQGDPSPHSVPSYYSDIRAERVDTVAARRSLVKEAKRVAREEDEELKSEGLHIASSDDKVASYRGVGLGLYFKVLHWLIWMMIWMMLCAVPYIITINTSVFTDYAHRHDHTFGIKVFDSFELSSFTFAAIVDSKKDNGTLQYMNTEIADAWKGPMRKGVFLTWISLVDAGATVVLTAAVVLLFFKVDRWLRRVDKRTLEASDYSIIVGGLPPTITATEVGRYFETHFTKDPKTDKVMDVVLVRGFSAVVDACKEVHRNEQLKCFVAKLESDKGKGDPIKAPKPEPTPEAAAALNTAVLPYSPISHHGGASRRGVFTPKLDVSNASSASGTVICSEKISDAATGDVISTGNFCRTNSTNSIHSHGSSTVYAKAAAEAAAALAAGETIGAAGGSPAKAPVTAIVKGSPIGLRLTAVATSSPVCAGGGAAAGDTLGSPRDPEAGGMLLPMPPPRTQSQKAAGQRQVAPSAIILSESLSVDMSREMRKVEARIAQQRDRVMQRVEEGKLLADAALVTFNTEAMRINACKELPSGWWPSWFMRRRYLLSHGGRKWRIWVRRAAAPDDYRWENMATRIRTNVLIQVLTGAVMFAFILVCAAFITWLSAAANKEQRTPLWNHHEMTSAIQVGIAKLASSPAATAGLNKTMYDTFCAAAMPSCSRYVNTKFTAAEIDIKFGSEWAFPNATTRLLNERPVRKDLQQCSEGVSCAASYCLPCYCLGLSHLSTDDASAELLTHINDACSTYQQPFGLQRDGIKVAISLVIAIINGLLTYVLRLLKFYVEKHWTTTDTELSFAVWAYLVKLINSVAVLLIVNCSTLRNLQEKALAHEARWLQKLILDGLYDDFTPEWYNAVGFSVMILMMINVVSPLLRTLVDWGVKVALRVRLACMHCGRLGAPEEYNTAFRSMQFTLEVRVSDVLFNVTLALLFGSGMPLCYLICAVYLLMSYWWDRVNLLALSQPAQRYQQHLPRFIMQVLPLLLAAHCAFGLWMHTYFKAEMDNMDLVAAASSGLQSPGINSLSENSLARRITQPNGLALLIWFVTLSVWLLFGRWIIWSTLKVLGASCVKLTTFLRSRGRGGGQGESDVTYEDALSTVKVDRMLRGARTYRVHHLPNYKPFLTTGEAGRLWAAAQGQTRFTRLNTFRVMVEVETAEGRHRRIEQREVEMFDVSDGPITAPALACAPNAAASRRLVANPLAALPPASEHEHEQQQQPGGQEPTPRQHRQLQPQLQPQCVVQLSSVPSTALQIAALRQVAVLQANTGVIVRRVSLRPSNPLLDGLQAPGEPPPPAFELDFTPVTAAAVAAAAAAAGVGVRTGAALRATDSTAAAATAATSRRLEADESAAVPKGTLSLGSRSSAPALRLTLDRSPSAASSGPRSVASFKSAPASWIAASPPRGAAAAATAAAPASPTSPPPPPAAAAVATGAAGSVAAAEHEAEAEGMCGASAATIATDDDSSASLGSGRFASSTVSEHRSPDRRPGGSGGGKAADAGAAVAARVGADVEAERQRPPPTEAVEVAAVAVAVAATAAAVAAATPAENSDEEVEQHDRVRRAEGEQEDEQEEEGSGGVRAPAAQAVESKPVESARDRAEGGSSGAKEQEQEPERAAAAGVVRQGAVGVKERARSGGSGIPTASALALPPMYPPRSARGAADEGRYGRGESVRSRSTLLDPSGVSGDGADAGGGVGSWGSRRGRASAAMEALNSAASTGSTGSGRSSGSGSRIPAPPSWRTPSKVAEP